MCPASPKGGTGWTQFGLLCDESGGEKSGKQPARYQHQPNVRDGESGENDASDATQQVSPSSESGMAEH